MSKWDCKVHGTMKPIIEQVLGQIHTEYENGVMRAVQSYGFDVDKDRLLQALTDARAFYEEGYMAAMYRPDVVEVVRCKDCKHLGRAVRLFAGDTPVDVAACALFKMSPRTLNEFCSCGERRVDDG